MKIMHRHLKAIFLLSLLLTLTAQAQTGQQLTQSVTAGGGDTSSAASSEVDGTIGQSVTGTSSVGSFSLESGFWPGASALTPSLLSVSDATGTYGSTAILTAKLSANGNNLSGKLITFSLNANPVGTATTDSNGLATLTNVSLSGVNAGTYVGAVSAQFAGDTTFAAINSTAQLTVQKATPSLQVAGGTFVFDGQAHAASASTTGVNNEALSPITVLYNGTSSVPVNAGTYTVMASFAGNTNYNSVVNNQQSIVINPASQTITVTTHAPATATYNSNFTVAATASSSLPITYSSSGSCTNSGASFTMTSGTGTCTVMYNQGGNGNYNAATQVVESVTAQKVSQAITFDTLSSKTFGDTDFNVNATASSGLAVSFAANGQCTVNGNTVHLTGAGSCQIIASQAGNSNYNAANDVQQSFQIAKANQIITFGALLNKTYGDADFNVNAIASSGLSVSFSASGQCTVIGTTVRITGAGSCTITASQAGDSNYNAAPSVNQTFTINKATASVTLGNLTQTYDSTPKSATASTNPPGLSVTFAYTQNGTSVTSPTAVGNYNVTATITDANYTGTTSGILIIAKATPVITWNNPANITFGTPLSSTQLNATASVAGTFVYNPPVGTFLSVGPHQLFVTFTPADAANYLIVSGSVQITVNQTTAAGLNLDSSTYTVNEGDGHVTITVNRTGNGADAASVDYTTSDTAGLQDCSVFNGVASSRCDYATTVGTLRFAPGETSKTIFIPIVNDSYLEGPESFKITLNNAQGENLGTVSSATITIADDETTAGINPISNPLFFIRQQYIDFLGREPDPPGYQGWQNILTNCGTSVQQPCDRIEVSSDFFRSPEFQARGYFIFRFYAASLGKNPMYAEFMPDLGRVSGFLTDAQLEASKAAFVQEFMTRSGFVNRYGSLSNAAFVDSLIQTSGLQSHPLRGPWIDVLNNGTATRAQVLRAFVESKEVYNRFYNQAFVVMQYFGYLRRDPDALYTQWIETLNQTGDFHTMISGFINSNEYAQRFGP